MDSEASQGKARTHRDAVDEPGTPDESGLSSALSRHAPPQPAELREARTGLINLKELRAQEDPAVGLLDTLQAVREKQSPPAKSSTSDSAPGVVTSSEGSPLGRFLSGRSAIFIGMALAVILMVWGVMQVLDRASSPIVPPSSGSRPTVQDVETKQPAERGATRSAPTSGSVPPHLSRPVFPRSAAAPHNENPPPRAGISHSSENDDSATASASNSTTTEDLDAEKEKQRQRDEEERQRESGMSEADTAQGSNTAPADSGSQNGENENRAPQSVSPEDSPPAPADGEITTY